MNDVCHCLSRSGASDDCHASPSLLKKAKRPFSPDTPGGGSSRSSPAPRHREARRSSPDPSSQVDRHGSLNLDSPNPLRRGHRRVSPESFGRGKHNTSAHHQPREGEGSERSGVQGKAHPKVKLKGKAAPLSKREELQNELDWQTDQLTYKVTKVCACMPVCAGPHAESYFY